MSTLAQRTRWALIYHWRHNLRWTWKKIAFELRVSESNAQQQCKRHIQHIKDQAEFKKLLAGHMLVRTIQVEDADA
jgi:hypothetical protein